MSIKIMRLPAVIECTGMSRSSIYAGVKCGTFPRPCRLSCRAVGWLETEIENWVKSLRKGNACGEVA